MSLHFLVTLREYLHSEKKGNKTLPLGYYCCKLKTVPFFLLNNDVYEIVPLKVPYYGQSKCYIQSGCRGAVLLKISAGNGK